MGFWDGLWIGGCIFLGLCAVSKSIDDLVKELKQWRKHFRQ